MIICGIDPGPTHSALVRVSTETQRIVEHVIRPNTSAFFSNLGMGADHVVIEDIVGYGQRVGAEVFLTCKWIGRFWERCELHHCTPTFLSRPQVLRGLGIGPQDKGNKDALVRGKLILTFGGSKDVAVGLKKTPGPLYGLKEDEWSALAVALVYMEQGGWRTPGNAPIVHPNPARVPTILHAPTQAFQRIQARVRTNQEDV